MGNSKLKPDWFLQTDVVKLAKELIGLCLVTNINGIETSGIITETEAYEGITDKASHAYGGRRTKRTETMFQEGGISYVYLCYGIHSLFNVVTNMQDVPHAILVRSIFPLEGYDIMLKRKGIKQSSLKIGMGPGNVTKCLGIGLEHNALSLQENTIWIEKRNSVKLTAQLIQTGKRIGIDYAQEDALLPYRFWVEHKSIPNFTV
ncbi:MAG: DNA-3-methyladenine glycosylase [Sediminibacterium sp.]|nr:DNA-3-methyladenine glycosylase [Sediminibacterium sp.]